jgi:small subunit ribosomal protein S9
MTEDPRTPQDDETPAAAGDVAEPEQSADPGEAPAEQPAAEAEQPAAEEPAAAEQPAAEEPAAADQPAAEAEQPAAEEPTAEAEQPAAAAEQSAAEEPTAGDTTAADEPGGATAEGVNAPDAPANAPDVVGPEGAEEAGSGAEAGAQAAGVDEGSDDAADRRERPKPGAKGRKREKGDGSEEPDVVPGAHLEPDLVLESESAAPAGPDEFGAYAQTYEDPATGETIEGQPAGEGAADQPAPRTPLDLAADARYRATGKRKTSVARVILKPGDGTYTVNGRPLDVFFPRLGLQLQARQPLETAGYQTRMDVVAKIHGGGVSAQAGALRHGIARALVEADPNLRTELKRRGFLTRDARVKERKKAGLKKARKRPQFSKR